MAQIHNTGELRERAHDHARHDRILQGTYGKAKTNGMVEFWGCAIACLSTPSKMAALREWVRDHLSSTGVYADSEYSMLRRLEEDFGIVPELARAIEHIFEAFRYHGEAIEFLPKVADAMPEGAEIDGADVKTLWSQLTYRGEVAESGADHGFGGDWSANEAANGLLDWLRSLKVEVTA